MSCPLIGRGAYTQRQACIHSLLHQSFDTWPERKFTAFDEFDEGRGLFLVHPLDEVVLLLWLYLDAKTFSMEVVSHPLLATGYLKQFVVFLHVPLKAISKFLERLVEGHPMAVPLRVNDDPILVEYERLDFKAFLRHFSSS